MERATYAVLPSQHTLYDRAVEQAVRLNEHVMRREEDASVVRVPGRQIYQQQSAETARACGAGANNKKTRFTFFEFRFPFSSVLIYIPRAGNLSKIIFFRI